MAIDSTGVPGSAGSVANCLSIDAVMAMGFFDYVYDAEPLRDLGAKLAFAKTAIFKIPGVGMDYFVTFEK